VTACDIEKSFIFEKTVEIISHMCLVMVDSSQLTFVHKFKVT